MLIAQALKIALFREESLDSAPSIVKMLLVELELLNVRQLGNRLRFNDKSSSFCGCDPGELRVPSTLITQHSIQ
ncbi:hypothetical protein Hypma_004269 [Hypsizygus marmoreus]|uniref:Uncharacterized protein n=1 Tax=Hypsizygus marmoreus TaxID=39966 RepID=A0A369J0K8_HYPMA|nr:hypothetical protein Hypma_004269 [Hypsizygus marmoreus]